MAGGGVATTASGVNSSSKVAAILMVMFAAFGGILFGYDTGTIGGILGMPYWQREFGSLQPDGTINISTSQKSLTVSILSVGTVVGALLAFPFGDLLGRKLGIMASCVVFSVGVLLQTISTELNLFIVGRVIAGLGVGLVSCLVPLYQSEISPRWIRGFVVGSYQWAITIGLLLAAIADNGTKDRNDSGSYRIPVAIQFAWALILAGGLFVLPESPRWLIKKNREHQARRSLSRLLKVPVEDPAVEQEYRDIYVNLQQEIAIGAGTSYIDCFRNGPSRNGLRTWTGIGLQALQQLTGVNFIFYYGTTFFQQAGIQDAFTISIITSVVNVVMTVPGILLIDRAGRRSMLLVGAIGMCVCQYIVAIVGVATPVGNISAQRVLIAFVCIYIAFFAATWGPIAWVVTGEIYPLSIRAKCMSMSTASNWILNFAIGYATPYMVDPGEGNANLGVKVFFVWATACFICIAFTFFFIPETKGLSLEQVDLLYKNSSILGSEKYRKTLLATDARPSTTAAMGDRRMSTESVKPGMLAKHNENVVDEDKASNEKANMA